MSRPYNRFPRCFQGEFLLARQRPESAAFLEPPHQSASWSINTIGLESSEAISRHRRGSLRLPPKPVMLEVLVREREDDYEGDHNKGDRISVKSFPIDVNTHRTALLFAEVTAKTINPGCLRSNSLPAMPKAQQHFGCAALMQIPLHLSNDQP
jgi:hypothetical protein